MIHHVALPFVHVDGGRAPGEAGKRPHEAAAIRRAQAMACSEAIAGAVAFFRRGSSDLGEFEDAGPQRLGSAVEGVDCEFLLRRVDGGGQPFQSTALAFGFIEQPAAQISVVVGTVERLLKPPVQFLLRGGFALEFLELAEGNVDTGVGQRRQRVRPRLAPSALATSRHSAIAAA